MRKTRVLGESQEADNCLSISGTMTGALVVYSATFMRYSLAVSPKNYLLFGCHLINFSAQATQGYRYLSYFKYVYVHSPVPVGGG